MCVRVWKWLFILIRRNFYSKCIIPFRQRRPAFQTHFHHVCLSSVNLTLITSRQSYESLGQQIKGGLNIWRIKRKVVFCQVLFPMKQSNHDKDGKKSETFFSSWSFFISLSLSGFHQTKRQPRGWSKAKTSKMPFPFTIKHNRRFIPFRFVSFCPYREKDKPRCWTKKN